MRLPFFILSFFIAFNIGVQNAYSKDNEEYKILLFGDSIIAGYGVAQKDSLPSKLQQYFIDEDKPNVKVINAGVSGDTTSGGASRLKWALDKNKPDLLVLALGGNDILRGIPPKTVDANIGTMLQIAKDAGVKTVMNKVEAPQSLGIIYKAQFDRIYEKRADEFDIELFPFLLTNTFGKITLMQADGIHPNPAGVDIIVAELGEFLNDKIDD